MKIDLMHILPAWKPLLLIEGLDLAYVDFMLEVKRRNDYL